MEEKEFVLGVDGKMIKTLTFVLIAVLDLKSKNLVNTQELPIFRQYERDDIDVL